MIDQNTALASRCSRAVVKLVSIVLILASVFQFGCATHDSRFSNHHDSMVNRPLLESQEQNSSARLESTEGDVLNEGITHTNQGAALLLAKAERFLADGQFEKAGANAERAVRLEAKSPRGYMLIAQIRLKQHQWGAAEHWAKKALRYAEHDYKPNIQRYTAWSIIAESRRRSGDLSGALAAQEHLNTLESNGFGVY